MVAMQQQKDKSKKQTAERFSEDEDDFDDESFNGYSDGESLLSLVQPEMITLSKHWLAALKDHALLSLPAGKCFYVCRMSNRIWKTRNNKLPIPTWLPFGMQGDLCVCILF